MPTANAAETVAEAIRLISSNTIPGLGPPDIYYPPYFIGKWRVTRLITTSDDNFWKEIKLPVKIVSEMRFVPYDTYSKGEGTKDGAGGSNNYVPAIADRSFNELSYYSALSEEMNRVAAASTVTAIPPIQSLEWTPNNPNVLFLSYVDGSSKEIKVTPTINYASKNYKRIPSGHGCWSS